MEKEFVPYEIALALKELGFDEPCFAKYYQQDGNTPFIQIGESEIEEAENAGDDVTFECDSPLYQQAFSWFREKYGYFVVPQVEIQIDKIEVHFLIIKFGENRVRTKKFKTYEEAELECLKKLIEIVKSKTK